MIKFATLLIESVAVNNKVNNSKYLSEMRLYDGSGRRLYLNGDERERFLKAADEESREYSVFCYFLHYTGCRISECREVTADRISLEEGTVTIRSLKKRKYDLKGRQKKPEFRSIPLPDSVIKSLNLVFNIRSIKRSKKELYKPFWPQNRSTLYRIIKQVMNRAEISDSQATPKGLRHGFGIAMATHMPLNVLSQAMGHSSTKTTEIYLQFVDSEKRELFVNAWDSQ